MSFTYFLLYYINSKVNMSIAFIPIETSQDLFNNKVVTEKWSQFVEGITEQISSTLKIECSQELIGTILQETLEEHYTLQSKKPTVKEKKPERLQCEHILKNNKQCPNKANIGKTLCARHNK